VAWQTGIEHITDDKALWPALWAANRTVAEAYGLTAEDMAHILSTFPVFARKRPEFYAYLNDRVSEWNKESELKKSPAMLHAVSTLEIQPLTTHIAPEFKVASARKSNPRKASDQFKQATIFAWVIQQLYTPGHPVSRFRAGKMIYLIERGMQLGLFQNYLKQAAGPYDPGLRYKGPENIAVHQQQWLVPVDESHFHPGPKINEVQKYARRYLNLAQAAAVIEHFKTYQDQTLSRWTTVEMAARELRAQGETINPQRILSYIQTVMEWRHKLERDEFSPDLIAGTLAGLQKLGFLS
jgi:type I restriction enzyme S subunit